jgi:hypothetical protein
MELITIILAGLLVAIAPVGFVVDRVVEDNLRDRVASVEELKVRIDNAPSFQVAEGKIDRIRIASRGVQPIPNLRVAVAELETDTINIDLQRLQSEGGGALPQALREPFQGAFRLVITEDDLDRALQSPNIKSRLEKVLNSFVGQVSETSAPPSFKVLQAQIDFIKNNRFGLSLRLAQSENNQERAEPIDINLEVGLDLISGRSLSLVNPKGTVNGKQLSTRLLRGLAKGLSDELDLNRLQERGIAARVLQFSLTEEELNLAAFVRVEPSQEQ